MATLLLEAFIITITECFSDEISEPEISNHILKREGTLDLSKDEGFIELYNLVSDYSKTSKNAEQINYFISKVEKDGDLNSEEMELFAQSMGHESRDAAAEYTQRFIELNISLDNRYDIFDMKQDELEGVFLLGFENMETYSSNNCERRRSNCKVIASSIYTGALIACGAAGAGLAALNFWNAGFVGFATAAVCTTAATAGWLASMDNCNLDYADCVGS